MKSFSEMLQENKNTVRYRDLLGKKTMKIDKKKYYVVYDIINPGASWTTISEFKNEAEAIKAAGNSDSNETARIYLGSDLAGKDFTNPYTQR